jgi:hypothetical protein
LIDKVVIYPQPHVMDAAGNRHYTIRAIPYEDSEMEAARLKVLHERGSCSHGLTRRKVTETECHLPV